MHCLSIDCSNWNKRAILTGLDADDKEGLRTGNYGDCSMSMYVVGFWACRFSRVACCRTLETNSLCSAVVAVFHRVV